MARKIETGIVDENRRALYCGPSVVDHRGVRITDSYDDIETSLCERVCPFCGINRAYEVPYRYIYRLEQNPSSVPEVSPNIRELFISGVCDVCWAEMEGASEE